MASLNKVTLIGNLGADPELRYTQNQTPVAQFNIATTEVWTGKDGQKNEKTEWHRIVAWDKLGENCSKYLAKGRQVYVEGKLVTRKWQDKDGADRYTTEIVASEVKFLGSKPQGQEEGQSRPQTQQQPRQQVRQADPGTPDSGMNYDLNQIPF